MLFFSVISVASMTQCIVQECSKTSAGFEITEELHKFIEQTFQEPQPWPVVLCCIMGLCAPVWAMALRLLKSRARLGEPGDPVCLYRPIQQLTWMRRYFCHCSNCNAWRNGSSIHTHTQTHKHTHVNKNSSERYCIGEYNIRAQGQK